MIASTFHLGPVHCATVEEATDLARKMGEVLADAGFMFDEVQVTWPGETKVYPLR